jgi:hypothetical protein
MPHDPTAAALALARLQVAEQRFLEAQGDRRLAILDAVLADNPLRQVASTAHVSHDTIRRIVAKDGRVAIEFDGNEYRLSGQTIDDVLYKLTGFAHGAFSLNAAVHGTGNAWLAAAGDLAGQIEAARASETGDPVRLTDETAFALHQSLLQSAKTNPSVLLDLTEALRATYRPSLSRS